MQSLYHNPTNPNKKINRHVSPAYCGHKSEGHFRFVDFPDAARGCAGVLLSMPPVSELLTR